jgi:hypothetical protein
VHDFSLNTALPRWKAMAQFEHEAALAGAIIEKSPRMRALSNKGRMGGPQFDSVVRDFSRQFVRNCCARAESLACGSINPTVAPEPTRQRIGGAFSGGLAAVAFKFFGATLIRQQ